MGAHEISFAPRLLSVTDAAAYLGISAGTLRTLPIPRKAVGSRRLFDRLDLDSYAAGLPYEGDQDEAGECDKAFGT